MKTLLILCVISFFAHMTYAQNSRTLTEASDLTITGKLIKTANPYHRVDTSEFNGFSKTENFQIRCSSGLAVLFKTNSTSITILPVYGESRRSTVTPDLAQLGFDLYIKKNGEWIFAGSGVGKKLNDGKSITLIKDMDGTMKECMINLPMYSEMLSVKIGTDKDSYISAIDSPFRHRVAIYGSSYTQGACISRPGMSYPNQFIRNTGIQLLNIGCGGNCKMQSYFAEVLKASEVDAMIFDCFSNPNAELIKERTIPFIKMIRESHPDIPLIFISSVYRENRNFSLKNEQYEQSKMDMAEEVMEKAVKEFENVYFINIKSLTGKGHDSSVDGVHPSDMGYTSWAKEIEKPVMKILKRHGIK